jgi:hypothetical protein
LPEEEDCCAEVRCIPSNVVNREDARWNGLMSAAVMVAGAGTDICANPDETKALWLSALAVD